MNSPTPPPAAPAPAVRIRPALPADAAALARLWREMWDLHAALDPRFEAGPDADRHMEAWLRAHASSPDACLRVAELDGRPVGYVLALILENPPVVPVRRYGFLSELAVTAAERRRGLGTRLLEAAHGWLASKGVAVVEANVAARNAVSRRFWRKQGYEDYVERVRRNLGG